VRNKIKHFEFKFSLGFILYADSLDYPCVMYTIDLKKLLLNTQRYIESNIRKSARQGNRGNNSHCLHDTLFINKHETKNS
jgi:hypothetical protein